VKIFILLIFLNTWGLGDGHPPIQKIVESPEHAAMLLWQYNPHYTGKLYKIQLDRETVEEVPIPETAFDWKVLPVPEYDLNYE